MKEVKRPWGLFKQFIFNQKCTVKILELKPKQELSLQVHKKRDEMWYFLDNAIVQLGKKRISVREGDLIKVKKKTPHRIIAKKGKARVLEISLGTFDEKDEIRLEDKYGRK
jgi:mannose-6-phosphate isomerase-like protein (cupin superfamily)